MNWREMIKDKSFDIELYLQEQEDYINTLKYEIHMLEDLHNIRYCEIITEKYNVQIQNKTYESRIDKAIKYVENCSGYLWSNANRKALVNILKGDEINDRRKIIRIFQK